jgi:hypothetical protein
MAKWEQWTVVAEDGEYLISVDIEIKRLSTIVLKVRVNQQLVVEEEGIAPYLDLSYSLPIGKHEAVLEVWLSLPVLGMIYPKYRLVVDNVEIPPAQRIVLREIASVSAHSDGSARSGISVTEELEKLANLKARGLIDEAEFTAMKEKLIGRM